MQLTQFVLEEGDIAERLVLSTREADPVGLLSARDILRRLQADAEEVPLPEEVGTDFVIGLGKPTFSLSDPVGSSVADTLFRTRWEERERAKHPARRRYSFYLTPRTTRTDKQSSPPHYLFSLLTRGADVLCEADALSLLARSRIAPAVLRGDVGINGIPEEVERNNVRVWQSITAHLPALLGDRCPESKMTSFAGLMAIAILEDLVP